MTTAPSLFTKFVTGELPCHKVYEDDRTLAFLNIFPASDGHVLVIPKTQVEFVWDLSDDDYAALMATVKRVARRLRDVFGKPYVGELIVGVGVPHAHVHLVPFASADEMAAEFQTEKDEADAALLAAIAKRLSF
ncbi:MAG TPA: HIT domain-containing protein [Candidatus Saccharimonadales bacterium]|jgi:histidine triad (HIT) family protein